MDNNKMFMFMALLGVAFIVVILFFNNPWTKKSTPTTTVTTEERVESDNNTVEDTTIKEKKKFSALISREDAVSPTTEIIYENKNIRVVFDPERAEIKDAWVKDTFLENSNLMYNLVKGGSVERDDTLARDRVENQESPNAMILTFGSWENKMTVQSLTDNDVYYTFRKTDTDTKTSFYFTTKIEDLETNEIYTIEKNFHFYKHTNFFNTEININNEENNPVKFDNSQYAFSLGWGPLLGVDSKTGNKAILKRQENLFKYYDEDKIFKTQKVKDNDKILKDGKEKKDFGTLSQTTDRKWVGNVGHYFAAVTASDENNYDFFFDYRQKDDKDFYSGYSIKTSKSKINTDFTTYIGPKIKWYIKDQEDILNMAANIDLDENKIPEVEEKILFGLGNRIGQVLTLFNKFFKNYGLTIIIITILIKLLLFPLTYKSMQSQQKMAKIQPKVKELQTKHKDQPEVLNRETMKLYQKEGINPLGGCLPMLLQMPLLLAMYRLLNGMIELKGASFLWISDLSQPDAVLMFPFTIPLVNINSLNLLPFLMVGTQILSSLLTPTDSSNKQAQMMMWLLPVFFFLMFYNVSSGLVLYWTVMNVLNFGQQFLMKKLKKI